MIGLILAVLVILLILAVIPAWPYSRGWGYGPGGVLSAILAVVLIVWLVGVL